MDNHWCIDSLSVQGGIMNTYILNIDMVDKYAEPIAVNPTGRWYLHDNLMYIEVDYGIRYDPEYMYESRRFLGFLWERDVRVLKRLIERPIWTKFVSELMLIDDINECK